MKYRITLSDRRNRRTVEACSAKGAVMLAVGRRLYSLQQSSAGTFRQEVWNVRTAVMTRNGGFTPVREIRAYVETI